MTQALSAIAWALLGSATLVAQDDAVRIEPMPGPLLRDWDPSAPDCAMAIRVVDAITHEGIAGAVLYSVPERNRPRGGEFWFAWRAEADAFGFLLVPPHARGWFVHRAPGHGIASQSSYPIEGTYGNHVQHLYPALPWRLALRDPFDRPIAHAEVGYCVGCGHTPDVQVAHSDAHGIVTIPDCDPTFGSADSGNDIYVRAAGVSPEYDSEDWRLGDPPTRVRREFARTVRGTVLAPDGKPLAGAIVRSGAYGLHRGPYSWTDAAGAFVAWGRSECTIEVGTEQFDARFPAIADAFVVQLPASKQAAAGPLAELVVRVVDAATGAPFADASVDAWSVGVQAESPGDAVGEEATEDEAEPAAGEFRLRLPIGPVGVEVAANQADDAWTVYEPVRFDLHLPAGTTERVVRLARRPTLRVTAAADTRVTLRTRRDGFAELDLTDAIAEGRPIPVPAHEPFALLAYPRSAEDSYGLERFHVVSSPPPQVVHVEPWRPTRLLVQVLDGERMPVPARLRLSKSHGDLSRNAPGDEDAEAEDTEAVEPAPPVPANESPSGWHELPTWLVGCAWLFVEPLDATHRPFAVHLGLPELGVDRVVDLGVLQPPTLAAPSVRVLDKDGAPLAGKLEILRPGLGVEGELAADGGWNGMVPSAGDRLTATADRDDAGGDVPHGQAPLTTRLVGNGPWVLREGRGTVRFEATDDRGMALDEGALLFGLREYRVEHVFELRSVPAGEHEFFLAANGCHGARIRVRLADGERRVVPVVLRRAPR